MMMRAHELVIFTILLKPALSYLRKQGYTLVMYIDDLWIQGEDYDQCKKAVKESIWLLDKLGFTIHQDKSIFEPCQEIEFLGFLMNSVNMTITISAKKACKIRTECTKILQKTEVSIKQLSEIIRQLAAEPGNRYATIFFKRLEILRNKALTEHKENMWLLEA